MITQAVLWDNDGLLVDSEAIFFAVTCAAFARIDLDLSKELWGIHYLGEGIGSRNLALLMGADPNRIDPVIAERNQQFRDALKQQPPAIRPQVTETLTALSGQVKMAMVTGSGREAVDLMHASSGLLDFFDAVITSDDYQTPKPSPDAYLTALRALKVQPEACFAVEDSQRGLRSAVAAGIACVVVPTELTEMQDFSAARSVEKDVSGILPYMV